MLTGSPKELFTHGMSLLVGEHDLILHICRRYCENKRKAFSLFEGWTLSERWQVTSLTEFRLISRTTSKGQDITGEGADR